MEDGSQPSRSLTLQDILVNFSGINAREIRSDEVKLWLKFQFVREFLFPTLGL